MYASITNNNIEYLYSALSLKQFKAVSNDSVSYFEFCQLSFFNFGHYFVSFGYNYVLFLFLFPDRPSEARVIGPSHAIKGEIATLRCSVVDRGKL